MTQISDSDMDEPVDFVDHEDIYISPTKKNSSPVKMPKKTGLPAKKSRPRSPKKSQTVEDIEPVIKQRWERPKNEIKDSESVLLSVSMTPNKRHAGTKRAKKEVESISDASISNISLVEDEVESDEYFSESLKPEISPRKRHSPRKKLVFKVDNNQVKTLRDKTEDEIEPKQAFDFRNTKLNLDPKFKPTSVPKEGEYNLPDDKAQLYFYDGFEGFIDQSKIIRKKHKSQSSMTSAPSITRDEFNVFSRLADELLHRSSSNAVQSLHENLFQQFTFELLQGFSLLFYGIGSKRLFLESFVLGFLSMKIALIQNPNIAENSECVPVVVVNGYNQNCNFRTIIHQINSIMMEGEEREDEKQGFAYWNHHIDIEIDNLVEFFKHKPPKIKLILLLQNLDGPVLRKDGLQTKLSTLAQMKQICIVASVDHFQAPIMWDHFKAQSFNFVYHDITNFEPYMIETTSVNNPIQLNSTSFNVFNLDGAKYVFESLTSNSKKMYKLLLDSITSKMEAKQTSRTVLNESAKCTNAYGILLSDLFRTCTEQFIASNEMALRSMLSEFVDHGMAIISKNNLGKETVHTNYTFGDMKKLSSELLSNV